MAINSHNFLKQLTAALGYEGRQVRKIVLTLEVNSAVTATVEEFVDGKRLETVLEIIALSPVAMQRPAAPEADPPMVGYERTDCPRCDGTGKYSSLGEPARDCAVCDGSGRV